MTAATTLALAVWGSFALLVGVFAYLLRSVVRSPGRLVEVDR